MNDYKEAVEMNSSSMRIENIRASRISPSSLEGEVHGTKTCFYDPSDKHPFAK